MYVNISKYLICLVSKTKQLMHEKKDHVFAQRQNKLPILLSLLSLRFSDSPQCNFLFPVIYKHHWWELVSFNSLQIFFDCKLYYFLILCCTQEYNTKNLNFLYSLKFLKALVVRYLVVRSFVVRSLLVKHFGGTIRLKLSSTCKLNQQLFRVIKKFIFYF